MKLLKNKLVLLALGVLVGAGGVAGAASTVGLPFLPAKAAKAVEQEPVGIVVPLKERIVNLADSGVLRYLKTTIALEVVDHSIKGEAPKGEEYKKKQDELTKELRGQLPIIDDQIMAVLSARTSAELMTPDGKQNLKSELRARLNKALHQELVMGVYFTDFIIQ